MIGHARLILSSMRRICIYVLVAQDTVLAKRDGKAERLKLQGALNRHPQQVRAPWFQADRFFDARDLVQVKYEMLRQVRIEGARRPMPPRSLAFPVQHFIKPKRRSPSGARRLAAQQRGPRRASQAHTRSHGVYRYTFARRTSAQRPRALSGDKARAWSVCPSSQHRTRLGAQKNDRCPPAAIATRCDGCDLRAAALEVLLRRTRPEGIGAVIYHGLLQGVALLCSAPDRERPLACNPSQAPRSPVLENDLLRLLTNMVLQTQSEVMHVY